MKIIATKMVTENISQLTVGDFNPRCDGRV